MLNQLVIWLHPQNIWVQYNQETGLAHDVNGQPVGLTSADVKDVQMLHSGESFVDFVQRVKKPLTTSEMIERLRTKQPFDESKLDAVLAEMQSRVNSMKPK